MANYTMVQSKEGILTKKSIKYFDFDFDFFYYITIVHSAFKHV